MASTATASNTTMRDIIHDLAMYNPAIIQVSPDKPNLLFGVKKVDNLRDAFMPLILSLKSKRLGLLFFIQVS